MRKLLDTLRKVVRSRRERPAQYWRFETLTDDIVGEAISDHPEAVITMTVIGPKSCRVRASNVHFTSNYNGWG